MVIPFFRKGPEGPAEAKPAAKKKPTPGDPHTSTLDFTQGDARALAAAADRIQVDELSDNEHPAVEEAAILFANNSDDAAAMVLEAALDEGAQGNETLWNMLFDLYRLANRKEPFDQRGVAYATQFGRSPPVWSGPEDAPKKVARDSTPSVSLTGTLGTQAGAQFEQIARIAQRAGKLKIDLGRLRGAEEAGCQLLVDFLRSLRQAKVKVVLANARNMLPMVENQAQAGQRENQGGWLMTLEILQALGEQDRFDEVALDYAITFEESPPSYEPPPALPAPTMGKAVEATTTGGLELVPIESEQANFAFEGELSSAQGEPIRKLAKYGADRNVVDVDASRLNRVDFVSAGNLFNVLTQFQTQGKVTTFHNVNAMVAALLRVMGVQHVAQIELRRI